MDSIKAYLNAIGKIPLLTPDEEIIMGRAVQKALEIENSIPPEQWTSAHKRLVAHGKRAKKRMIECNLRLVVNIAKKYTRFGLDFMDLTQEGALGLNRAVEKFDPERGYKFSTYSYWWIRQAMTRALDTQSRTIRVPVHLAEVHSKIRRFTREFSQESNRSPTVKEISEYCDIKEERIREVFAAYMPMTSLDTSRLDDPSTSLAQVIPDQSSIPAQEDEQSSAELAKLAGVVSLLTDKEKQILEYRYGVGTGSPLTLKQTASLLAENEENEHPLSRERVRQIENRALLKLRLAVGLAPKEEPSEQLQLTL